MDPIENINRYLKISARTTPDEPPRGELPFITISRECGAGGHTLAQAIIEAFEARKGDHLFEGWKVFDRELCELVASDKDLNVGLRSLLDESTLNAVEDMVSMMFGKSPQRDVQTKVAETIRELAVVGKAIIVGRGGECVTRDLPCGVHFRLVAPLSIRVERQLADRGGDAAEVERFVKEQDWNRARFVEKTYGRKIDDPLLYDGIWNTERIPVDLLAKAAVDWVEATKSR